LLPYERKKGRQKAVVAEKGRGSLRDGTARWKAIGGVALAAALTALALIPCAALGASSGTTGTPAARIPYPRVSVLPPAGLDDATRKATELQRQLDELQAESNAIEARIKATTDRIYKQSIVVETARSQEASAQAQFDDRIVGMYKAGSLTPLELMLSAPTFRDAFDRGVFLLTIVERDQRMLEDATRISSDAAYQSNVLEGLRAQSVGLRQAHDDRVQIMQSALGKQQQLVAQLTDRQKQYLVAQAAQDAAEQNQWKNSGFYGADVPKVNASVEGFPWPFLVDEGEPTAYATVTSVPVEAVCSWYGNADNTPTPTSTSSGRAFNENEFTCAFRRGTDFVKQLGQQMGQPGLTDLPWGTRLALTCNGNHIIVAVTDHGPYVDGRDLDLSKSAAHTLGYDGVATVMVQVVKPK
jgi:rare lipoprotein A (peptidoglycan hydrolase)